MEGHGMEEAENFRNVMVDEKGRKFVIHLENLYFGWLDAEWVLGGEKFYLSSDEAFDWVIDLVQVYIAVRDYGKEEAGSRWEQGMASWYWNEGAEVNLDVYHQKEDFFRLHVKVRFYDGDPEIFEKTVDLTREELLEGLDRFFKEILNHKGFPYQFPAGCRDHEKGTYEKAEAMMNELLEVVPKKCWDDEDVYIGLDTFCRNAACKPTEETGRYIEAYRKMLENHEWPSFFR